MALRKQALRTSKAQTSLRGVWVEPLWFAHSKFGFRESIYTIELYNYESCGDNTVQDCSQPQEEDLQPFLREEVEIAVELIIYQQNLQTKQLSVWGTKAELRARVGRPQTSSSPPVIFIAGRPKAALLFWFFGDFRCGALLFMVIHVIYKYKNR